MIELLFCWVIENIVFEKYKKHDLIEHVHA